MLNQTVLPKQLVEVVVVAAREDLSAELVGLIYRQRWRIELFFKWIEMIPNCRHWLAESPAGVEVQIYCVHRLPAADDGDPAAHQTHG